MNFYKTAEELGAIKRYAGINLKRPESVAEHSYYVILLSLALVEDYNLRNPQKTISVEEVMKKATLHDLEEGVLGDIPTPIKKQPGFRASYIAKAKKVMKEYILQGLAGSISRNWFGLWERDKDEESGEIIKLADRLQAYLTSKREVEAGNKEMIEVMENITQDLESAEYQDLFNKYSLAKNFFKENISSIEAAA